MAVGARPSTQAGIGAGTWLAGWLAGWLARLVAPHPSQSTDAGIFGRARGGCQNAACQLRPGLLLHGQVPTCNSRRPTNRNACLAHMCSGEIDAPDANRSGLGGECSPRVRPDDGATDEDPPQMSRVASKTHESRRPPARLRRAIGCGDAGIFLALPRTTNPHPLKPAMTTHPSSVPPGWIWVHVRTYSPHRIELLLCCYCGGGGRGGQRV